VYHTWVLPWKEQKWHQLKVKWFKKASSFLKKEIRATTGASKKKTVVKQRILAMREEESESRQRK